MKPKLPEVYFDHKGDGYALRLEESRFITLGKADVKLHLRRAGLTDDNIIKGVGLGEVENFLYLTQVERAVDYSGPLAGHKCGVFNDASGLRVLVTSEPRKVASKAGSLDKWDKFLTELLGEQTRHFLWWLKCARASQQRGDFAPGQLVVLAGPSGCGKSLLQLLVTEFLGGRSAKPYAFMVGDTTYNGECAGAEHLVIEDQAASHDIRKRRVFGAKLKEFIVNRELYIHPKGRQAISLPTFRRMTLSVNDEAENLMILPPLDPSILDKVILFKCSVADLDGERADNWQAFIKELPALAAHVERLKIPKEWHCPRYGVKAFHNAELLAMVAEVAPETHLVRVIDEVLFGKDNKEGLPWRGSAQELERELRQSKFAFAVERLIYSPSICGVYLARLAMKEPERFSQTRSKGKNNWHIKAPRGEA